MELITNKLTSYADEHYCIKDIKVLQHYTEFLRVNKFEIIEKPYGFIIYKFDGDACIIQDIYTTLDARKQGKAWDLFKAVKNKVDNNENCRVIIGFTENAAKDNSDSEGAMLAAGFKPIYKLIDRTVYIRGTN